MLSKVVLLDLRNLHQRAKQSDLERSVSMHWYHNPLSSSLHRINLVAPVDPSEDPASPLDCASEISA